MQKFELTQAEIAAMVALVDTEIDDVVVSHRKALSQYIHCLEFNDLSTKAHGADRAVLDYYRERLRMLRALKAKLEREEADTT